MLISWKYKTDKGNELILSGEFDGCYWTTLRVLRHRVGRGSTQSYLVNPVNIVSISNTNINSEILVIAAWDLYPRIISKIIGNFYKYVFISKKVKNYDRIYSALTSHISLFGKQIGVIIPY